MQDNAALTDVGRRLRHLAKTGGLFVTYPTPVREQISESGVSDLELLNVLRTGAISEMTGLGNFRVTGRLDDATAIEMLITFDEVSDRKTAQSVPRVRIDKINWPNGRSAKKKELVKKRRTEIVIKLRAV